MYRTGHYGAALLAYAPVAFVVATVGLRSLALVGGVGIVLLATLPDYDQRVPFVTHRGPTHTVWFALAVGVVLTAAGGIAGARSGPIDAAGLGVFGFAVGSLAVGSHIAADALTPAGVRPFAPFRSRRYTYDVTTAANPIANYALLAIGGVATSVALAAGTAVASAIG